MKAQKTVVFDFDQTLTEKHLYHALYSNIGDGMMSNVTRGTKRREKLRTHDITYEFLVNFIFGGHERLNKLITFLQYLKTNQNANLIISSHGYVNDIVAALEILHKMNYNISPQMFKIIHGRPDFDIAKNGFESLDPLTMKRENSGNKAEFIKNLDGQIIFIDDDEPRRYYPCCAAITIEMIPPKRGITPKDCENILSELLRLSA